VSLIEKLPALANNKLIRQTDSFFFFLIPERYFVTIRQSNGITRTPTKTSCIRLTVLSV